MNDTIYLVDAYAHIYRGYHAIPLLSTKAGKPSNALLAIGKFLLSIKKDLKPEYGVFVFDKGPPLDRLKIFPEYKATRPPMPDELRVQIEPLRRMIKAFGWNLIEKEGVEADDIIATLACRFVDSKVDIISNDKDISQIIDNRITMLVTSTGQKGFEIRNVKAVEEKFAVQPSQVIDYLSLIGDASDNIQGLQGVGPKTAAKLLKEYGSLDNIIASVEQIQNESLREKIQKSSEALRKNVKLITLDKNIAIDGANVKENLLINTPDINALVSIAEEYELKSLISDFKKFSTEGQSQNEFCF